MDGRLLYFTFAFVFVTFHKGIESSPIPSIASPSKPSLTFETDKQEKELTTTEGTPAKFFLGPSISSDEHQALVIANRNRIKAQRLEDIKNRILNFVGHNQSPPSITQAQMGKKREFLNGLEKLGREPRPFSGQIQTFNAACNSPQNVDEDVWNSPEYFHIYFNVSALDSWAQTPIGETAKMTLNPNETTVKPIVETTTPNSGQTRKAKRSLNFSILSSKLKIYKFGQESDVEEQEEIKVPRPEPSEPCNETMKLDKTARPTISLEETFTEAEENIRISLYWYTQPLTKHHIKRKLLDTKMVSVRDSKWIEFDIQKALKAWLEKGINYGLFIEVDNEDNDLLDAKKYLANPCISSPEKETEDDLEKNPASVDSLLLPVLDVCTLSIPSREPNRGNPFFPISVPTSVLTRNSNNGTDLTNKTSTFDPLMQNDGFVPIVLNPSNQTQHRHRHHHGMNKDQKKNQRQSRKRNSHGGTNEPNLPASESKLERNEDKKKYVLDEDHPLRQILLAGSPERRKKGNSELTIGDEQKSNENDGFSEEGPDDTIIKKIYITPPLQSRGAFSRNR